MLIFLFSCKLNEKTAAETYLDNHSEQEIVNYFSEASLFYCDFNNPQDIPEDKLYTFAMFNEKKSWFNETEQVFHIPIADIYEILNNYLDDYNLPIEWFENNFEGEYDTINQIITAQAIGMGTGCTSYAFINAEIIDTQNIKITLLEYCEDYSLNDFSSNIYITAKIVNGKAKFTSYIRKSNTS